MIELDQNGRIRLREMLADVEKQKLIVKSANESMSDTRKLAKKDLGVATDVFNSLLEIRMKQNIEEKKQKLTDAESLYQELYDSAS